MVRSYFLVLILALAACAPASSGGGGGGGPPALNLNIPQEGQIVDALTVFSVSGSDIGNVEFLLNNVLQDTVFTSPYEWTFDPAKYPLGEIRLELVVGFSVGGFTRVTRNFVVERSVSLQDIQTAVANLAPGTWYEVPNSRMRSAAWKEGFTPDGGATFPGSFSNIISAASGGIFDTSRNRLIVFGGGSDWPGNDIYAFELSSYRWTRLIDPSPVGPGANGSPTFPDGRPVGRHTYDYIEYLPPPVDRMFVGGGSGLWSGQSNDHNTWLFDFNALEWEQKSMTPAASVGAVAGVDANGHVWQAGDTAPGISVYDPVADTWTVHSIVPPTFGNARTAAVDPTRNLFVAVGRGTTMIWDLDNPDDPAFDMATSGDDEIEDIISPGIVYHAASDRIVGWMGGKTVYTLNLDTGVWTKIDSPGAVDPGPQSERGTFGRWRYAPSIDRFLVVNSTDLNVFVYRMP